MPGFVTLFRKIAVDPLGEREAEAALLGVAERMDLRPDAATRASLITLSARFFPARPQPAPALDLLRQLKSSASAARPPCRLKGRARLVPGHGLPEFVVSRRSTRPAARSASGFKSGSSASPRPSRRS
ncbi:MAG: hypothetical protein IPI35_34515 [Deltaproteobacteria bacterium]|nr:hypothetical protein [Deltaproteobacteria bacterium]